jgi:hypothetical protein
VQFISFPFTRGQITAFKASGVRILIGLGHSDCAHMAARHRSAPRWLACRHRRRAAAQTVDAMVGMPNNPVAIQTTT